MSFTHPAVTNRIYLEVILVSKVITGLEVADTVPSRGDELLYSEADSAKLNHVSQGHTDAIFRLFHLMCAALHIFCSDHAFPFHVGHSNDLPGLLKMIVVFIDFAVFLVECLIVVQPVGTALVDN